MTVTLASAPHLPQHLAEIAALEDEKRILYEQFVEGEVSRDDFKVRNAKLTADIIELQRVQAAIEAQNKKQSAIQLGSTAFTQAAGTLKGRRTLTEEIVAALIDKVKISPDGSVEVEWKVEVAK